MRKKYLLAHTPRPLSPTSLRDPRFADPFMPSSGPSPYDPLMTTERPQRFAFLRQPRKISCHAITGDRPTVLRVLAENPAGFSGGLSQISGPTSAGWLTHFSPW